VFNKKWTEYSSGPDVVFINRFSGNYHKTDTVFITASSYKKDLIPLVIPGDQTFNFAQLYKLDGKDTLSLDSSSCLSRQFMLLNISKYEKGDYLLNDWGCHYGHSFILILR
jgi:hypothetical protein